MMSLYLIQLVPMSLVPFNELWLIITNTNGWNDPARQKAVPRHDRPHLLHLLPESGLQFAALRLQLLPLGLQAPQRNATLTQLQRIRLFYLFAFTWIADFVWVVYWGVTWSSDDYQRSGASGTSSFVLTLSIIAFILKVRLTPFSWPSSSFCTFSTLTARPP